MNVETETDVFASPQPVKLILLLEVTKSGLRGSVLTGGL